VTKPTNSRELVLGILLLVNRQEEYSHIAIRNVLEKYQYLEKQERAFITRVAQGTLERQIELDYIINQFSDIKINKMKPVIRNILRMSVYQMKFMESVPDAAICNEAVKLTQKKGFHNLKGFVNGVLRNIARNLEQVQYPKESDPIPYLSVKYSMPEWIVREWMEVYGQTVTEKMLEAFLKKPALSIRVNLEKISKEELKERLEQRGIRVSEVPYPEYALRMEDYNYLGAIPEFREGLFQVQDISSMLVTEAAAPKAGDICLDVCAAPGGKSLHLAEKLRGTGQVEARDLTEFKADLIRENIKRMGVTNVTVKVRDACEFQEDSLEKADIVLADLPCSGLGVLSKKTDLKYRMTKDQQRELAALQRKILHTVQQYVKPGGTLLYSTCTISQEENEENVRWFLKEHAFEAASLDPYLPEALRGETTPKGYLQLLPGIVGTDGFFIAKFRKKLP